MTKGLKEQVKDCDAEHSFGETNHAVQSAASWIINRDCISYRTHYAIHLPAPYYWKSLRSIVHD